MLQKSYLFDKDKAESVPIVRRAYLAVEHQLFVVSLYLRHSSSLSALTFILVQWLPITLQLCRFIGDSYVAYQWDARVSDVFMAVCNFVSRFQAIDNTLAVFHIACAIVYGPWVLAVVAYVVHSMLNWEWPFAVAFHAIELASTTLFLPAAAVLLQTFFGCFDVPTGFPHPFFPRELTCWSDQMSGYTFASFFLLTIYALSSVFVHLSLFPTDLPQDLNGRNIFLARTFNRAEAMGVFIKLTLLILFVSGGSASWRGPLGFMLLLGGGMMTAFHLHWFECYDDTLAALYLGQWLLVLWAGVVAVFVSFLNDAEGTGMLFFIGVPLVAVMAVCLVRWRYTAAASMEHREFTSGQAYVIKARSLIRTYILSNSSWYHWTDSSPGLCEARAKLLEAVDCVLEQGTVRFPECVRLRCFRAHYFRTLRDNRVMSVRELAILDQMEALIDVRFNVYAAHAQLDASVDRYRSREVERYLEFKHKKELADKALSDASQQLVQFWSELLKTNPSVDVMGDVGHDARENLSAALKYYERLLKINAESVPVMRTMGLLHLHITGELQKASDFLEKADHVEQTRKKNLITQTEKGFMVHHSVSLDIFDDRNAVIGISLAEDNFGAMETVNTAAHRIFGFDSTLEMLGKNVSVITPKEIADPHDDLMRRFLQRKTSRVVGHTRTVFGNHAATGFLVPVDLYVRWSGEFTLVGVLQPILVEPGQCYVMLDSHTGFIIGATREFLQIYGLSRKELYSRSLTMDMIVPALHNDDADIVHEMWRKMAKKNGLETIAMHAITGRRMRLHMWSVTLDLIDTSLTFLKLEAKQMEDEMDAARDVSDDEDENTLFSSKLASAIATLDDDDTQADYSFPQPYSSYSYSSHTASTHDEKAPLPAQMLPYAQYPLSARGSNSSLTSNSSGSLQSNVLPLTSPQSVFVSSSSQVSHLPLPGHASTASSSFVLTSSGASTGAQKSPFAAMGVNGFPPQSSPHTSSGVGSAQSHNNLNIYEQETPQQLSLRHTLSLAAPATGQQSAPNSGVYLSARPMPKVRKAQEEVGSLAAPPSHRSGRDRGVDADDEETTATTGSHGARGRDADSYARNREATTLLASPAPAPLVSLLGSLNGPTSPTISAEPAQPYSPLFKGKPGLNIGIPDPSSPQSARHRSPKADAAEAGGFSARNSYNGSGLNLSARSNDASSVSDLTASARRLRTLRLFRRLKRAIRNDDRLTEHKLQQMNLFALVMVVVMGIAALVLYFILEAEIKTLHKMYDLIYYSSTRGTYVSETMCQLVSYAFQLGKPGALVYQYHPFVHAANTTAAVTAFSRQHYVTMINKYSLVSAMIESFQFSQETAAVHNLRIASTLPMEYLVGGAAKVMYTSLEEASRSYSALHQRILWLLDSAGVGVAMIDFGYWWIMVNGVRRIRDATKMLTDMIMDIFVSYKNEIVLQPVYVLLVSLAVMLLMTWFMVRPIVLRVENGKTQVLEMFLDIPRAIRRALRRKALIVYTGMRRQEEEDTGMRAHAEDEDEDMQARNDQAALENLSSDENDVIARYANMRRQRDDRTKDSVRGLSWREDVRDNESEGVLRKDNVPVRDAPGKKTTLARHPSHAHEDQEKTIDLGALNANIQRAAKHTQDSRSAALAEAERERERQMQKKDWFLSRRALRIFYGKYAAFVLLVVAYFVAYSVLTNQYLTEYASFSQLFIISSRRLPLLQMSWHMSRLNLLTDYSSLAESDPTNMYLRTGDFVTFGRELYNDASESNRAATFGSKEISRREIPELRHVLFENPCDVPRSRFTELGLVVEDYFFENCARVAGGVLHKGMTALWLETTDQLVPLLSSRYANALYYIENPAAIPPHSSYAEMDGAMSRMNDVGQYINFFLGPLVKLSAAMIHEDAMQSVMVFRDIRIILLIMYLAVLVLLYLTVLYPTALSLRKDANRTHSLMLLLAPDIIRQVPAIQDYIAVNVCLDQ